MKHRISESQMNLLANIVSKHSPDLLPTLDNIGIKPLSDEQRRKLRRAIADELSEAGFDEEDEPNHYGYQLEALINILGHI